MTVTEAAAPAIGTNPPTAAPARRMSAPLLSLAATVGLIVAVLLVLAVAVVPALTGGKAMTVLTGSMQPGLPPGHIAVYYPVPANDLKPGDVIAYMPAGDRTNGVPITHRIAGIKSPAGYVTPILVQGDANRFPDPALEPGQVIGKMIYYVPYVGLLRVASFSLGLSWLQTLVSVGLISYGTVLLIADVRKRRRARI